MSDYIKREDATGIFVTAKEQVYTIDDVMEMLASANVAPVRHGRWKPFDRTWGRSVFTCSACGECMDVPTEMGNPIFDYCPNCGAKMDGERKDNEID